VVGVTTHWEALKATKPVKFSLRLLDATGRAFVVTDYLPQDNAPTHDPWQPGAPQRDLRGILLSPDLPPGEYTISLTLYDPETGAITPAGDESALQLAQIQVAPATAPPKPEALPIPARLHARMGEELELLGYGIEPDPARPDATETLYLWWRALSPPAQPYQVQAKLVGRNGETVSDSVQPLSSAPADTWGEGQIVGARYLGRLPPDVGPSIMADATGRWAGTAPRCGSDQGEDPASDVRPAVRRPTPGYAAGRQDHAAQVCLRWPHRRRR
jgi:hypothetical protein